MLHQPLVIVVVGRQVAQIQAECLPVSKSVRKHDRQVLRGSRRQWITRHCGKKHSHKPQKLTFCGILSVTCMAALFKRLIPARYCPPR